MHTNGFCHLWPGKIYDSEPQSCKQSTKQQTLAPYGILQRHNLKAGAGRVGGESPQQKSAPRHFLFKPAESDMAFEERRRGSIINPHFLLQTADATLTALSAKPAAGKAFCENLPQEGMGWAEGTEGAQANAGAPRAHTFPGRQDQAGQTAETGPEERREPGEIWGGNSARIRPPPALD